MLPSAHPSAATAQALRKRLLTTLASYDTISKRIRELPLNEGSLPGGSQDRLQRAVAARGTLFLGEKLGLLRSLGNLDELAGEGKNKKGKQGGKDAKQSGETTVKSLASLLAENGGAGDIVNEKVGPELEASGRLTVLLECVRIFLLISPPFALTSELRSQARSTRTILCRGRQRTTTV